MPLTDYHAKYLAHELTRRSSSDSVDKLSTALADAQVDLNPHQVDAALFAFRSPFSKGAILADEVGLGKTIEGGLLLAQKWAERGGGRKVASLEPLVGHSGWLRCLRVTVNSVEPEDHVVLFGVSDENLELEVEQCRRLFDLPAVAGQMVDVPPGPTAALDRFGTVAEATLLDSAQTRGGRWFDAEIDKLERWADDRRSTLKAALDQLDDQLKEAKRQARTAATLPEKLERQRDVKHLDARRHEAWKDYDRSWREVEQRKDDLLDGLQRQMLTYVERMELFTVRFTVR